MKTYKFKIKGIDCANCANELERSLQKIEIIDNVNISFMMQRLTFECMEENEEAALEIIKKVIRKEVSDAYIEE